MEHLSFFLFKLTLSALLLFVAWQPIEKHMRAYRARERQAFTDGTSMDRNESYWPRETGKYVPLAVALLVILTSPFVMPEPGPRVVYKYVSPPPVYLEYPASVPYEMPKLPSQLLLEDILNPQK